MWSWTDLMFGFFDRLLEPFPADRAQNPPESLAGFCWHFVRDARGLFAVIVVLTALIGAAEVLLFGFLGDIVDWLAEADRATFWREERGTLIFMGFVTLVFLPVLSAVHALVMHQSLLGNLPMSARWRMHRFLLRQSMSFFSDEFAGRVATKVMQTSLAMRDALTKLIDVFVYVIVYFATTLVLVALADIRLAAPIFIWLVTYISIVFFFVPRLKKVAQRQADARSLMTGRIVDSYTNIGTVKLFAHAGREESYARRAMEQFLGTVHPQMRLVSLFEIAVAINNHLVIFAVAGLGIFFWQSGDISIGAIATACALSLRFNGMSHWIMWEVAALFEQIGTIYDGKSMLTRPTDVVDAPDAHPLNVVHGAIRYKGISFHYGKAGGVIDNFSLSIAPGEKIGLVGRSGAGKSTLVNLLLRFYDVEKGTIEIDGTDIASVTQDSLRANIGVVTQDTALLHRSLRDNIAYGSPDASDAEIQHAVERANAWSFIETLKDRKGRKGLDAHVGERGVRLSGGQRQRIAIARVFLKDAPILVLDEATSALDSEVEAAIQDNLFELMKDKTVIAIAHRLSTIAQLDRLIVIDDGRVIEAGSHDDLIRHGGLYADLWARQSGGFLAEGQPGALTAEGLSDRPATG